MVSQAGVLLPAEVAATVGVTQALSRELAPWHKPGAVHDPGKIITDMAVALAMGGDCPADVAGLRGQPQLFGPVASDPTMSRMVDVLARAGELVLAALRRARAAARARAWQLGGTPSQPQHADGRQLLVLDPDATLVTAHSEKESAARTWKKGFGFHPLLAYLDHGEGGTGEPLSGVLRPGNAGSNTAADHQHVVEQALAQLPACWSEPDGAGRIPVLVLLTPCVDYVIVFSTLAGASGQRLLAATPLLLLAQMLLLPGYLYLFLGSELATIVEPGPFLEAFLTLIVFPLTLAWVTQAWATRRPSGQTVADAMGTAMVPLLAATLLTVVASQVPKLGDNLADIAHIVPFYVLFLLVMPFVGLAVTRLFRLNTPDSRAVVFTGATRNSLVVLPLALALPDRLAIAAVVVVTQTLVEVLGMVLYIRVIPRLLLTG